MKRSVLLLPFAASFLLSACVSQTRYDSLEGQQNQLQQSMAAQVAQNSANNAEIAAMKKDIAAQKTQIDRLVGAIKYTVNSDLLFPSGSWQMSTAGQQIIAKLAPKLAPDQQSKVVVNGFTDNTPVGSALSRQGVSSNEILSQKRADTVMQYLISQGVKPALVSARGYGETQPVAPNDTAQGRAQNRRVEITLAESGS
ncbi:MAG TPA: OmpA family protein [Stellaceae bacterium]|nr:OmpA family protein [Stellaceae bacterium]